VFSRWLLIFTTVKNNFPILLILLLVVFGACRKESFTNSKEARLTMGNDSLFHY
jgi:hypothetical protein